MIRLGVSVYPEQESISDIDAYLAIASKYGFTKVFTSLFSVPGTKEEVIHYFKDFSAIAHKYGMIISGDANFEFFTKMGATETDLSVFQEMGIDTIRMDSSFDDERDAILVNNKEGIHIEMSTTFVDIIETAIANGADIQNISVCYNFFPQRYTGASLDAVNQLNNYWHGKGIPVGIFISSQVKGTHGPWPVSDGLPTIEDHRDLPADLQLRHLLSLGNVDEVIFGNAYASEDEFKAIDRVMKEAYVHIPKNEAAFGAMADHMPHGDVQRLPFRIELRPDITALEKEILFQYPTHSDQGDGMYYMARSRAPRVLYKNQSIPARECGKIWFTRGDVVIVNDNLAHYHGEIQIVLRDMRVDGQRNLLGHIPEEELMLLDHIKAGDLFCFIEK